MEREKYEKIIANAIQSEIKAQKFYQDVADKMSDAGLKDLFRRLADEERGHQEILEKFLKDEFAYLHFPQFTDYKIAEAVDDPVVSDQMKPADAFALAMKKEEEAMNYYNRIANACRDENQQKIFIELAAMERSHKFKMEQAFVDTGYPETWS